MRRPRLVASLYHLARLTRTLEILASGDPGKVVRRLLNLWIGRHVVSRLWLRPGRRGKTMRGLG